MNEINKKNEKILPVCEEIKDNNISSPPVTNLRKVAGNIFTGEEKESLKQDLINFLARRTLVVVLTIVLSISGVFGLFLFLERDRTNLYLKNQTLKTQADLLKHKIQNCQSNYSHYRELCKSLLNTKTKNS